MRGKGINLGTGGSGLDMGAREAETTTCTGLGLGELRGGESQGFPRVQPGNGRQ